MRVRKRMDQDGRGDGKKLERVEHLKEGKPQSEYIM